MVPPLRPISHRRMDLEALRAELKALMNSWEYAFAMGHGCSVGDHPQHQAVRQKVADLKALIAEHSLQ